MSKIYKICKTSGRIFDTLRQESPFPLILKVIKSKKVSLWPTFFRILPRILFFLSRFRFRFYKITGFDYAK